MEDVFPLPGRKASFILLGKIISIFLTETLNANLIPRDTF